MNLLALFTDKDGKKTPRTLFGYGVGTGHLHPDSRALYLWNYRKHKPTKWRRPWRTA